MSTAAGTTTADELLRLPDDGMRHELVAGVLSTMTPPGTEHGRLAFRVGALLDRHVRSGELGEVVVETGFILARDPDTVRAPDAAFISRERYESIGATPKYWPEAPALAVEVISPSDTFDEVETKAAGWLDAGTTVVLVVNPRDRTVTAHRAGTAALHRVGDVIGLDDAVPGFTLGVAELFA